MTPAQILLNGKMWGRVTQANDWHMINKRLCPAADLALSEWHRSVVALARKHALENNRALTVEDLRKGAVAVVAGKFASTKDLTNAQFSRLLTLYKLLCEPTDLDAILDWENPERERERGLQALIAKSAPDDYVRRIAADRFGTRLWENLEPRQLTQLWMTLKQRRVAQPKQPATAMLTDENGDPDWTV